MVDKIRQVASSLVEQRSDICLFAILKMDDLVDKWSVIVVSSTLSENQDERKGLFNAVLNALKENLEDEEMNAIARIGLFALDDHLTRDLMKFSRGAVIENQQVNGNFVYKGYILETRGMTDSDSR